MTFVHDIAYMTKYIYVHIYIHIRIHIYIYIYIYSETSLQGDREGYITQENDGKKKQKKI